MKLTLQWRSFLALVALLAALLITINVALTLLLPPYLRSRIESDLEREALLARAVLTSGDLNAVAHQLHQETGLRITVVAPDGRVLAESDKLEAELAVIENHLYRPEIQDALRTGTGHARRHSDTLNVDMAYVAVRANTGVVRVALPLHEIAAITGHVRRTVAGASLLVGLCAIPVMYWLTRRLTQPISRMREVAGSVARGDFSHQAPANLTGELGELATALNDMSAQLAARLHELGDEKAGLSAILTGMTEGVLVVDAAGKIRLMNAALRQQFNLTDDALGKTPLEVLRLVDLEQPGTRELTVFAPAERTFVVNAARLSAGLVIVFHDITRLKQLENLRQEFVANVSHELRTPLSIIKGYIETLLDEQPPDPATARQFLQTIQKHSRQLENLIEDLLSISALESQRAKLDFAPVNLHDLAGTVIAELAGQARAKNITVMLEDLPVVRGDRERLHQVFVNLIDNAIKYTQASGRVVISAKENTVCVADNGPGIAAEHLPRIFERFYRVDKARSRDLGGTGLGLSIVKHIVQAHSGRAWVESTVGQGSRFYVTFSAGT
jgi:two-component system phosphate regulon sensor histidine kinase PhoR